MIEKPRPDKVVCLNPETWTYTTTFHPEYIPLDPYAENLPFSVRRMDQDWLQLIEEIGPVVGNGISKGLAGVDEADRVEAYTNRWQDFDGRDVRGELGILFSRPEYEDDQAYLAVRQRIYSIYHNGIGIFRDLLIIDYPGVGHHSVLSHRFMDVQDRSTIQLLKSFFTS